MPDPESGFAGAADAFSARASGPDSPAKSVTISKQLARPSESFVKVPTAAELIGLSATQVFVRTHDCARIDVRREDR